uniref:tRNA1(Val) (adenine(37)-N6)-methyltransferase n=1 Tax=Daejeonella sp. TaxID=2805397 RepID=UPI00404B0627
MKVNTDGVLLAAILDGYAPAKILDIGTGTGLIALMLAQRFPSALIDAVEIDENTARTAKNNFSESPFLNRIRLFHSSIERYLLNYDGQYDLIVSNPPFFINSLRSEDPVKGMARHTDYSFFENLLNESANKLSKNGLLYIILPIETSIMIEKLMASVPELKIIGEILIHSFAASKPHRKVLKIGFKISEPMVKNFVIYEKAGIYTSEYRMLLKDFLTIF